MMTHRMFDNNDPKSTCSYFWPIDLQNDMAPLVRFDLSLGIEAVAVALAAAATAAAALVIRLRLAQKFFFGGPLC